MSNEIVKFSNQFNNVALKKFDAVHLDVLMAIASRVREKGTATAHLHATGGCIFRKRALRGPRALPFGFPPFRGSLPAGPGVLAAPLGTPCRRAEAPHPAARADHERSRSRWRSTICPSPT